MTYGLPWGLRPYTVIDYNNCEAAMANLRLAIEDLKDPPCKTNQMVAYISSLLKKKYDYIKCKLIGNFQLALCLHCV